MCMRVLVVILTVCCLLTLADKLNCNKGVIVPEDGYFLEGQDLVLTCWRKNGVEPRHLYFSRGAYREPLPEKYITRNRTAATLRIPNISAEDVKNHSTSMSYYCYDRRSTKHVCIYSVYVELDYFPKVAKDVSCIVYNWDSMTCSWDLGTEGMEYNKPGNYDVTCGYASKDDSSPDAVSNLIYMLREDDEYWHKCPEPHRTSCHWNGPHFHDPMLYVLRVSVTNKVLNITTHTQEMVFKVNDIVKPAPVRKVDTSVKHHSPETVNLEWNHTQVFRNFTYNLTVNSKCDTPKVYTIFHKVEDLDWLVPTQINITHLTPNTQYTATLKAKAFGGAGPWSEPIEISFKTQPAVPSFSPYTRNGFFEEIRGKCKTLKDCKKFKLYFKPLTKCEQFSSTTKYLVSSSLLNTTVQSTSFRAIAEVPKNISSFIELRAFCDEGVSTNYSGLTVYPEVARPKVDRDLVIQYDKNSGNCTATIVSVKEDPNFDNVSHTIVWCIGEAVCEKPIEWYKMGPSETKIQLPFQHCEHKYRLGITTDGQNIPTGETIATHIDWEPCLYEEGKVPKVPLQNVDVSEVGRTKFKVSWTPYACNTPDINYVEYYEVSYCPVSGTESCNCTEDLVSFNISNRETSFTVAVNNTLNKGCMWVRAKTIAGFGPNTDALFFNVTGVAVTRTLADEDFTTEAIVIGVSIGSLLLFVLTFFVMRHYCPKWKKRFEPVAIADIPVTVTSGRDDPYTDISTTKQDEEDIDKEVKPLLQDSGTSSLSSATSSQTEAACQNINGNDDINTREDCQLSALLKELPADSGDPYNSMPGDIELDEIDFDSIENTTSTGSKDQRIEQDIGGNFSVNDKDLTNKTVDTDFCSLKDHDFSGQTSSKLCEQTSTESVHSGSKDAIISTDYDFERINLETDNKNSPRVSTMESIDLGEASQDSVTEDQKSDHTETIEMSELEGGTNHSEHSDLSNCFGLSDLSESGPGYADPKDLSMESIDSEMENEQSIENGTLHDSTFSTSCNIQRAQEQILITKGNQSDGISDISSYSTSNLQIDTNLSGDHSNKSNINNAQSLTISPSGNSQGKHATCDKRDKSSMNKNYTKVKHSESGLWSPGSVNS